MWSIFSRDPIKDFAFEVGEKVPGLEDQSIWTLHNGKRKANGEPVSIFAFDSSADSNDAVKQVAISSIKRLKTLRHPNVLTFIDSLESPKCIYVVTEPVTPLCQHLKTMSQDSSRETAVSWGLHQIVKGLNFLVNTVNLIHNNVCMSSIFVDQSGEWKLGGVDYMYPVSGDGSNLPPFKTLPILEKYDPPEKSAKGRSRKTSKWSTDMWGLGCLIWEVFNGPLPRTSSLKVVGKIPKSLVTHYCELVSANPASRPNPENFIENCRNERCFMNNHFVDTNLFLEEIQIKDQKEKNDFFSELPKHLDSFPTDYSKHKILPQLLNAFQFGNAGSAVLPPLFKLGALLEPDEYQVKIVPCVVKLFSSTDRATRIHLLRQMHLFVEHLQPQVVNSQIFPNVVTGFMDTNPAIREQSIKAMLLLAPKLNDNNLNNELMKHFARLQSRDDQGPIRTNTTTRQKVLASAFTRAMRDPFPAARIAGVLAMAGNLRFFTTKDCAYKVLPSLSSLTVDPDKTVRDNSFKTISSFLDRLKQASDDPEFAAKIDADAAAASTSTTSSMVAGVSGWTGWMSTGVSSITSRLYKKGPEAQETADSQAKPTTTETTSKKEDLEQDNPETKENDDDDDDASDYGEKEDDGEGWGGNNDGWDDLEEFRSPITPMPVGNRQGNLSMPRKIVTSSKIRALEDDMWSGLNLKVKIEDSAEDDRNGEGDLDATNDANTGWDNTGWDDVGFDEKPKRSFTMSKQKRVTQSREQKPSKPKPISDWNEWEDESSVSSKISTKTFGWDDDWENEGDESTSTTTEKHDANLKPASSYHWGEEETINPDSDEFFSQILSKPAPKVSKKLTQPTKKSQQIRQAEKKGSKSTEESNEANDDWGWDDGWDNGNKGLSKAEQMRKQREEKKRQRQEEIQKKRAARAAGGGGKLGARKLD